MGGRADLSDLPIAALGGRARSPRAHRACGSSRTIRQLFQAVVIISATSIITVIITTIIIVIVIMFIITL